MQEEYVQKTGLVSKALSLADEKKKEVRFSSISPPFLTVILFLKQLGLLVFLEHCVFLICQFQE